MTKQFREAQIRFYINRIGLLNFQWGSFSHDKYDPKVSKLIFKLERRVVRELSRPIKEGDL